MLRILSTWVRHHIIVNAFCHPAPKAREGGHTLAERAKLPHCTLFISSLFIVPLLQRSYGKARKDFSLRASLTLAAIYSRGTYRPTTIDAPMFHFRVRNGTGWGHWAMTTRFQIYSYGLLGVILLTWPSLALGLLWFMYGCCFLVGGEAG